MVLILSEVRKSILEQMPPETRFQQSDEETISKHRELLKSWQEDLVKSFYDTLYNHPPTAQIFQDGERPAREDTLREWWKKVIEGPLDDKFFDWMTYVGLVHIVRKVKNPMFLTAWGHILRAISERAKANLSPDEAASLIAAFTRFGQTFTSLVAESYLKGVAEATGTSLTLLETLASQQISEMLGAAKQSLN